MPKGLSERLQDEIETREKHEGISPVDLLTLPENLRGLMQQVMRRGQISAAELVRELESP